MKNIFLIALNSLFLLGLNRLDAHQPLTDTLVKFDTAKVISQTFFSRRENLNTVSVCLRSPTRNLAPFRFELWQLEPRTLVRKIDFNGGNIDNEDCTKFKFEPVPDSQDRAFEFAIISTVVEEDPLARQSMHVEASSDNNYSQGSASLDGKPLLLDLHFKTHFAQPLSSVIRESWFQFISRFSRDLAFLIPYLFLLGVVIYFLCRKNSRSYS